MADPLLATLEVVDSIVELTKALVRIPSQAGIDPLEPMATAVAGWLTDRRLAASFVDPSDPSLGVVCRVGPVSDGPLWVLDATLDTAPIGDRTSWTVDPTSATVSDGWLYGRGSADSKVAIAMFAHLACEVAESRAGNRTAAGQLALLFDGDEHNGSFAGAKAFFGDLDPASVGGVMIGYPGHERIVTGGRGFLRAQLKVRGPSGHSGSSHPPAATAIGTAATLIRCLEQAPLPESGSEQRDRRFPIPPRLTVTAVHGGEGFSTVPSTCTVSVDIRLTPSFGIEAAQEHLHRVVGSAGHPDLPAIQVDIAGSWPAYLLAPESAVATALEAAAEDVLGRRLPRQVAGPSNAGNYLAGLGIEATAGFGVAYRNIHGDDECIDLSTVASTYAVYRRAVERLLA